MFDKTLNTTLLLILPNVSPMVFIEVVVCFSFVENLYLFYKIDISQFRYLASQRFTHPTISVYDAKRGKNRYVIDPYFINSIYAFVLDDKFSFFKNAY